MANGSGKMFAAPERIAERGRGCYSCLHFANGDLCRQRWETHKKALKAQMVGVTALADGDSSENTLKVAHLAGTGVPLDVAVDRVLEESRQKGSRASNMLRQLDADVKSGVLGMCVVGGAAGDFVYHQHLCTKWDARTGASLATSGRPLDKLTDELEDIADDKAKRRGG